MGNNEKNQEEKKDDSLAESLKTDLEQPKPADKKITAPQTSEPKEPPQDAEKKSWLPKWWAWRNRFKDIINQRKNNNNHFDNDQTGTKAIQKPKPWYLKTKIWILFSIILIIAIFIIASIASGHTSYVKVAFYTVLVQNFLALPAFLIGFIALLGNLIQGQKWYKAIAGAIRALVGFTILLLGSFILVAVAVPLFTYLEKAINLRSVFLQPYTGWTSAQQILGKAEQAGTYAVIIGFFVNIVYVALRRWTNCYSIFVSGQIMFQQAITLTMVFSLLMFIKIFPLGQQTILLSIFAGIVIGTYWAFGTNLMYRPTNDVTNNAGFTIAHQQMVGAWLAYTISKQTFGRKKAPFRSAENLKLPKGLSIFTDNIFTSSILILIFFGALFIILHATSLTNYNAALKEIGAANAFRGISGANAWWLVQVIGLAFEIVAAIQIIIFGVRMFVLELQKAFIGISKKLIPGATIGIDIAATLAFAPTSLILGFLSGAIGNILSMGIIIGLVVSKTVSLSVIIFAGFIPLFFDNAAFGIFSNKAGGWVAALVVPFLLGVVSIWGAYLVAGVIPTIANSGFYIGMWDWNVVWAIYFAIIHIVGVKAAPYMLIWLLPMFWIMMQFTNQGIKREGVPPLVKLFNHEKLQKFYKGKVKLQKLLLRSKKN